jgi:hypothetical protein
MKLGTRSVLFGAHQFLIHPVFVLVAWWQLYGPPLDPRLWLAFLIHDWGYWGSPNIDGPEGEAHPEWAARVMTRLCDRGLPGWAYLWLGTVPRRFPVGPWGQFCLFHSRYYARAAQRPPSPLCAADKLATALEPWWLYLPRVWASGELREFMARAGGKDGGKYAGDVNPPDIQAALDTGTVRGWHWAMTTDLRAWVRTQQSGRPHA